MEQRVMLWEKLDTSGKDASRVVQLRDEWVIQGKACIEHGRKNACVS